MKKLLLMACALLLIFCAPKQSTVQTDGLEEVIVFGDEETYVSDEPVLPIAPEEEVVAPPPVEEEPVLPPLPPEEEVVAPPPPPVEEEIVAPPPVATEEEIVMPPPIIEEEPYAPPPVTSTPPAPPAAPPPATLLGFRVQIFASSTETNASKVASDARPTFDETVYIEHIAPYYKVRVGDFLTRSEADMLKSKAIQLGFRGAFVVETMISP